MVFFFVLITPWLIISVFGFLVIKQPEPVDGEGEFLRSAA
jgi:hypothetical protein